MFPADAGEAAFCAGGGTYPAARAGTWGQSGEAGGGHGVAVVQLSDVEWVVLTALKREFAAEEISRDLWRGRAQETGLPLERFYQIAEALDRRKIIGRFSTFLEHAKPLKDGERVTRFNGLFHWAVPAGRGD